jgi:hypothetical protein
VACHLYLSQRHHHSIFPNSLGGKFHRDKFTLASAKAPICNSVVGEASAARSKENAYKQPSTYNSPNDLYHALLLLVRELLKELITLEVQQTGFDYSIEKKSFEQTDQGPATCERVRDRDARFDENHDITSNC